MIAMLAVVLMIGTCYASGGEGHHQVSIVDLLWPAVSFTTLFSVILFKLRKPIKSIFDKKAAEVEELYNQATSKKKEAKIKLDENKNRLLGVEADRQKIKNSFKKAAVDFSDKTKEETRQQIERLEKETISIIEYEKKKQIDEIDAQFVEEIIKQTKKNISNDEKLKTSASEKILSQIH